VKCRKLENQCDRGRFFVEICDYRIVPEVEYGQNVGTLDRLTGSSLQRNPLHPVRSGRINLMTALMLVLSGALLASAASGTCALYTHLGISTSEKL
jgi:hypothetical protein